MLNSRAISLSPRNRLMMMSCYVLQVLKEYDASSGDKIVVMKTFDEKKSVMDAKDSTTTVRRSTSR